MARLGDRRRWTWAIGTSFVFHALALAPILWIIPHLPPPQNILNLPIALQLRSVKEYESNAKSLPLAAIRSRHGLHGLSDAERRRMSEEEALVPAQVVTPESKGAASAGDHLAVTAATTPQPSNHGEGGSDAAVRRALRALAGCSGSIQLTEREQESCGREKSEQAAIGAQYEVDPISSSAKRGAFDHARAVCDQVYHYQALDGDDPQHLGHAPQVYGNPC